MPAVSVIVLVYNVRKYFRKTLESLFGQTLDDIEYIFVDDCSTDGSMDLMREALVRHPSRASQVKVITNEMNMGQAASRRIGVEASTGDYVIHCDSDDYIDTTMYMKMLAKACEENCDMVLCRMHEVDESGTEIRPVHDNLETPDVPGSVISGEIHHHLLDKLVRRSAYAPDFRYPVCNMCEDVAISVQLACNCTTFGFVDEVLYHYVRHDTSISSSADDEGKINQVRSNVDLAVSFLVDRDLSRRYASEIRSLKCWVLSLSQNLPRKYYFNIYPDMHFRMLLDGRRTVAEKVGHITKFLGVHGISKLIKRN